MRYETLLICAAGALANLPAASQSPAPAPRIFASAADVEQLIARAKATPGQTGVISDIVGLAPYKVHLEYRTVIAPAKIHEGDAELFYVIDGAGTAITGGSLAQETRTDAANLAGTAIIGGMQTHVAKGDFLIVPQGSPHQFRPDPTSALVLMSIHLPRPAGTH